MMREIGTNGRLNRDEWKGHFEEASSCIYPSRLSTAAVVATRSPLAARGASSMLCVRLFEHPQDRCRSIMISQVVQDWRALHRNVEFKQDSTDTPEYAFSGYFVLALALKLANHGSLKLNGLCPE
jgi:hypothetical protein